MLNVRMCISVLSNVIYINCKNVYISFEELLRILIVRMYISVLSNVIHIYIYILIVKMCISVLSNVIYINCKSVYVSFE